MRKASAVDQEQKQVGTIEELTDVYESISSTQIAKVKSKVELSKEFFALLWSHYTALRIDPKSRITERNVEGPLAHKQVFVLISAEGGLSGDIDQRLIETVTKNYKKDTTDIIVLGTHGANQLLQRGIPFVRYFQVPETDHYIDVSPIVDAVLPYSKIVIYYEEYQSLGVQEIQRIDLISSIKSMSEGVDENSMTPNETIFEPSINEIADQMEIGMMSLALSQAIIESGLAQSASRFNAMSEAKKHAMELLALLQLEYHRSRRSDSDRRLREVLVAIKKKRKHIAERTK